MLRVIDEIRPAWVVGENVAGITTMVEGGLLTDVGCHPSLFGEGDDVHEYVLRETFTIERICSDLERVGYSVQPVLIPAAAVGAPHRRDRVFFIAYDSHRGVEMRGAGEDESESESERIPERDTRQRAGESNNVLSEAGSSYADPYGKGRKEPQSRGRAEDCKEDGAGMDNRTKRSGWNGSSADTNLQRRNQPDSPEIAGKEKRLLDEEAGRWRDGSLYPERRWAAFPTVSPVHRGNDGLPFSLDDLTLPPTRWRTESLKAYGNAIVPQVMYEIFRAIEMVEQ